MINPIKLYLGLAAIAVVVAASIDAFGKTELDTKDEPNETETIPLTEADKKEAKAYKKARKKAIKAMHGIDMTTVHTIDARSGIATIEGKLLAYDSSTRRPFVSKGVLVIGKVDGVVNKLQRITSMLEVRLDNFNPEAITLIKYNDNGAVDFRTEDNLVNISVESYSTED